MKSVEYVLGGTTQVMVPLPNQVQGPEFKPQYFQKKPNSQKKSRYGHINIFPNAKAVKESKY
jgi:hypothetical protein